MNHAIPRLLNILGITALGCLLYISEATAVPWVDTVAEDPTSPGAYPLEKANNRDSKSDRQGGNHQDCTR